MTKKKLNKLIIVCSNYPYGTSETFLENEVKILAKYFDVELFPVIKKNRADVPRPIPENVTFNLPILSNNYYIRGIKGVFNFAPILPYIKDLLVIGRIPGNKMKNIQRWLLYLISSRSVLSSIRLKNALNAENNLVYHYWCNYPIGLKFNGVPENKSFIRVHGGEIDLLRHNYIPLLKHLLTRDQNVTYLPISNRAEFELNKLKKVNSKINRLGVYDYGLNPSVNEGDNTIRIVSCSNIIKLKRIVLIVEALKNIPNQTIHWIHFGDGPLYQEVKNYSDILPSNIRIEFKGRKKNREVLSYYSREHIDLFINVSETEGVPVSIMEAFSFGIPCFATNVGGTAEIVNKDNGYLARKDFSVGELSRFILEIREIGLKNDLRINARETWKRKCNAEINFTLLTDIFKNSYFDKDNKA